MGPQGRPDRARAEFDPWRHRFALALVAATVVLLAAGGLVTSTGSGLAVPDWPLSFGQVFPPMVGGVLFEHGHRMIAAAVGFLTLVALVWHLRRDPRRVVRGLAIASAVVVVAQGVLGGVTVLLRLPTAVSVAHACLAQAFFCLVVSTAWLTSRGQMEDGRRPDLGPMNASLPWLAMVATVAVYVQLILGALMRHTGAGLAIPDLPLAFGRLIPPFLSFEIAVHYAHRLLALLIGGLVLALWAGSRRQGARVDRTGPAWLALVLVMVQILLGAASVVTRLAVLPTTAHLVTGALLLATLLVLTLRLMRGRVPASPSVAQAQAEGSPA